MANEMHSAECQSTLIDQFKRCWTILGSPHPGSLYARNLLADLQAHGYSPEHVQSVVDRIKMLKEKAEAALGGQEVEDMTRLQQLDLESNRLETLPPEVGQWTAMQWLDLERNQLQTLPPEVGQWTAMQWLDLEHNQLQTLPAEIGQWTAMQQLWLNNNHLRTLPAEIGQWTAMQQLWLNNNQLQTLPDEVGQWTAMQELRLDNNQLHTLPDEVRQWTAMRELLLNDNQLQALPDEVGQWTAMQKLWLDSNQLQTLPAEIGQWTAMRELLLNGNQLHTLPDEVGQWTAMQELSLSNNHLRTLPAEVGQWTAMPELWLNNNQLQTLPDEVGQWTAMETLRLNDNQLQTLPGSISNLRNLRRLDLSGNRFTRVPDVLFDLPAHTEIFLLNNPLPPEEIQRVRDALRNRRAQGLQAPQLVLPDPPLEINQDNALQDAVAMNMNVHAQGLTTTVRQRIDELAAQFPGHLDGDIQAQQTEMRAIQQRLEQALQQYGQDHPSLSDARTVAAQMFATGLGTRGAFYNDFQYSAGHVLSYVFLAMERQWDQTPNTHVEEARANGVCRLIDQLVAGEGFCDTRHIEEVFQLADMALSEYADQHPEIVGKPISLSRTELREVALPAAKRLMAQLLQEPSSSQRSDAQEQQAFLARLTAELCNEGSRITPEQLALYVADEIVVAWDEFKDMAAKERP